MEDMSTVVLDAWAIVSWFNNEPAADRVAAEVGRAGRAIASWVNLGEVAYVRGRAIGVAEAQADVRRFATTISAELPDEQLVLAAARVKAAGGISYADAFAAATAQRHRAPLLTGDPELLALRAQIEVVDLRV